MLVVSDSDEKVPMDPEDYVALLAWVRAKEGRGEDGKNRGCAIL